MTLKTLALIGILLFAALTGWGQEAAPTSIAVYSIKAKGKADPSLGPVLTSLLITTLSNSPRLKVIEEETLKLVFERQGMNQSDLCDSTQCQVEIGKLVQAQKMVVGEISKIGETYLLTLRLTDIQTGSVDASIRRECRCGEDQLPALADQAALEIRRYYGEAVPGGGQAFAPVPASPPSSSSASSGPRSGRQSRRSYLGLEIQDVSPELAQSLGVKDLQGAVVTKVAEASPALKADLQVGDIVTQFANTPIRSSADVALAASGYGTGKPAAVKFLRNGQEQTRVLVLESMPAEIEIFVAASLGDPATVKALLDRQPDLVKRQRSDGVTPLQDAASRGQVEVVSLLLDRGAEVNARSGEGYTPLHYAASNGHLQVCELFLARGAEVNSNNNDGKTPLHYAASHGYREICELLLAKGAEVNAQDAKGNSPLHNAAYWGQQPVCALLLANGAGVNLQNQSGSTPLHFAAAQGHLEAVKLLLENGADAGLKNQEGKSPLQLAQDQDNKELVKLLSKHKGGMKW